ncbi:hypothetical protein E3P92_01191 [Wallemia ichthyophaga]|nr:hypothetical protein E3P92_01191 [Wallemia ichthyophaga]
MTKFPVSIKHAGKKFDLEFNTQYTGLDFKNQIHSLTGVAPDRQKVMIKGGMLKDNTDMEKLGSSIKPGHLFIVIGAAGPLPEAPNQKVVFMEDLSEKDLSQALKNPVGLTNLGNTCYLNSSVQVLRAIPELQSTLSNTQNSGLLRSLQSLFSSLNNSTDAITPTAFLTMLRSSYQQFTETDRYGQFAQQDAEEAWGAILNSLGSELMTSQGKSFVDQYMKGTFVKEMSTPESTLEEPSYSIEEFTKLGCNISSSTNYLQQGLTDGLDEQVTKHSSTLNRNAQYTQKSRINRLPAYLSVHLVRFYWRADLGKKAKILRKVKFPMEYDASDLVSDDLKAKINPVNKKLLSINKDKEERRRLRKRIKTRTDLEQKANEAKNTDDMLIDEIKDEQGKIGDVELLDENVYEEREKKELDELVNNDLKNDTGCSQSGLYDLVGIVTHKGVNADGGHYIAWVRGDVHKSEEDKDDWYKFDDNKVTKVSKDKIAQLEGGDGNYCITGEGETARKVKRLLDLKYGVGCSVDGHIKSSGLTIQIKTENEPKNSSTMDLRLQLPNTFDNLKNYLIELLAKPVRNDLFGNTRTPVDNEFLAADGCPSGGAVETAFGGTDADTDADALYYLFNQYQSYKDKDIYFNDGTILCASIYRWISQLSSEFLFDDLELFFNTYRLYLSSMELANLLFKRFEWTLQGGDDEPALELVRVRTFVMLRSWISNYFGFDFVPNLDLRLKLSRWINEQRKIQNDKSVKMIDKLINIAKERQSVYEIYKKHSHDGNLSSFDSSNSSRNSSTDKHLSLDFDPGPPTSLPSSTSSRMTASTAPSTSSPVNASEHNDSIADTFIKTFNKVGKIGKIGKRIMSNKPQVFDSDQDNNEDQFRDEYTVTISFQEFCQLQEIDVNNIIPKNTDKDDESNDKIKNNSIMTKFLQLDDIDSDIDSDEEVDEDVDDSAVKGKKLPHTDGAARLTTHSETMTDSQVDMDNWQKTFTIEGLESDEEDDGDVNAALRALEGHIDKVKQKQKLRKVESMMQKSKKKRMSQSQGVVSTDASENSSPNLSPIIRANSVLGGSASFTSNTIQPKPRSHSVAVTSPSLPINRKRGLSHGSSAIIDSHNTTKKSVCKSWILDYKTEELSKQFSLIEKDLFNEIKFEDIEKLDNWKEEYLKFDTIINWVSFMKEVARRKVSSNENLHGSSIKIVIARFNMTVRWVASEILITDSPEDRSAVVSKFIRLAFKCQQLNNFMTLIAILRGLDHPIVKRMADTWPNVSKQSMRMLTTLKVFCSNSDNYSILRDISMTLLNKKMSNSSSSDKRLTGITRDRSSSSGANSIPSHDIFSGCIPFVGMFLSDLFQADKCPNYVKKGDGDDKLINIQKLRLIHSTRKSIQSFQANSTQQYDHRLYLDGNLYRKCLKLRVDARVLE